MTVNGEEREVPEGATILELLEADGEPREHVLVEVNRQYVPRPAYARRLAAGDRIEVIHPAFGG